MPSLPQPFLSLVTDEGLGAEHIIEIARSCSAHRDLSIQLRARAMSGASLFDLAGRLREVTRSCGARLLLNDRVDVALAVEADGVHLTAASMSSIAARGLIGSGRLLGRSVHSLEEIEHERAAGAVDYLQFGPVFATASKAAYGPPQGLGRLARAVAAARPLAVVAVGGISVERVADVVASGAAGIAVITAVMRSADPYASTGRFLSALRAPRADRRTSR